MEKRHEAFSLIEMKKIVRHSLVNFPSYLFYQKNTSEKSFQFSFTDSTIKSLRMKLWKTVPHATIRGGARPPKAKMPQSYSPTYETCWRRATPKDREVVGEPTEKGHGCSVGEGSATSGEMADAQILGGNACNITLSMSKRQWHNFRCQKVGHTDC